MSGTELHELSALHALGALDAADAARLKSALAASPEAQAELAGLLDVAAALAVVTCAPARPAPALRDRILRQAASLAQPGADIELQERAAAQAVGAFDATDDSHQAVPAAKEAKTQAALRDTAAALALAALQPAPPPSHLRAKIIGRLAPRTPAPPPASGGFEFIGRDDRDWRRTPVPGLRFKLLSVSPDIGYRVRLVELAAGAKFPEHDHAGSEELFVLTGNLQTEGRLLGPGDFLHAEPGTHHHELLSPDGCTALIIDRAPRARRTLVS